MLNSFWQPIWIGSNNHSQARTASFWETLTKLHVGRVPYCMREKQLKIASHHQSFLSAITRVLCWRLNTYNFLIREDPNRKRKQKMETENWQTENRNFKKLKMENSKSRKAENEKQFPIPTDLILELMFLLNSVNSVSHIMFKRVTRLIPRERDLLWNKQHIEHHPHLCANMICQASGWIQNKLLD